jgi:hypothetical protein
MKQTDHDLLIELKTEVQNIRNDIKELKTGTTERIVQLEKDKADRAEVEALQVKVSKDIDIRVRNLEDWKTKRTEQIRDDGKYYAFIIGLGLLILGIFIWHLTGYRF